MVIAWIGFDLGFVVGTAFGATVACVAAWIATRRWATADLTRVMQVARYEASQTATRCVASLVPTSTERATVDLKPNTVLPLGDRPTRVYRRESTDPEHPT